MRAASAPARRATSRRFAFVSRNTARRALPAGVAALLGGLLPLLILEIWRADRGVPMTGYTSDGLFYLTMVKAVLEHGWFQENPTVGAPFGQEMYDFGGLSDTLSIAFIKVLGVFSSDPSFVTNLFFLATFPLTALTAFFVLRALGASEWTSVLCAVLFTLAPYHFARGLNGHLFLAAYYAVPLGVYLAMTVLAGERLFSKGHRRNRVAAWMTWRSAAIAALCAVIAWTGIYYALFTVILVVVAAAIAGLRTRSIRPFAPAGAVVAILTVAILATLAPNLMYRLANGPNESVGTRHPAESELYATKLAHLVLPVDNHRLKPLAQLKQDYASTTPAPPDYGVSLGAVATVGLVVLGFVLLAGIGLAASAGWRARRLHDASVIAAVTFLFVTVGGLSAVFAFLVSSQLRGWYRLSIFISFVALLAIALLLDLLRESRRVPPLLRRAFPVVLGAVLVVGVFDQASRSFVPNYTALAADFRSDREFVHAIERRLPAGSEVFQIPYVSFPESALHRMDAYDEGRGYVHSDSLKWSWGSMRGRPEDWQASLAEDRVEFVSTAVAAAGFEGIWVDRWGYADNGEDVVRRLGSLAGSEPMTSENGRLVFFDLRPLARRLRATRTPAALAGLREATLRPLGIDWGEGFWQPEEGPDGPHRWALATSEIVVENPSNVPRRAVLDTRLATGSSTPSTVTVEPPGGEGRLDLRVGSTPQRFRHAFVLEPGKNVIRFRTDAPPATPRPGDTRVLHLRFIDPEIEDAAAVRLGALG